jgi:hypothetical protein
MKKALMIVLAILIGVAFVTTVFATDKPAAAPEKAPAAEKKEVKKEEAAPAPKAKPMTFKGEFVSADAAAKTIVVKDDKGDKTFDVSGVKKMKEFKAGDKVAVHYTEKDGKMMASAVKAQKAAKKAEKKEAKPEEKPMAPKAEPAPAK